MQISYYHFRPSRKILNLDQKLLGKLLVKNFSSSAETLRTTLLISKRLQLQIEKINQKKNGLALSFLYSIFDYSGFIENPYFYCICLNHKIIICKTYFKFSEICVSKLGVP